ncbi:major facilitator superfamily domain-containing protein [Suillus bovinus]|uniref:major facilitator superfamily domain-containing protein n=1 Tax=Suillus bovinus TaxID=48563 RepID=UPI001B86BD91|nr:major facilitator superfamily domain-containing protein [Suillus bovinus]KAG2138727.1 major facilitator superfamily domain-containing protein [Suillus bovinus]
MIDLKLLLILNQINPFSSRHETSDNHDQEDFKLPNLASLVIMILMNLLLQVSFFIVISSSNKYAEYLGGNATFSGVAIGIPTAFAGLSLIPLTKYDRGMYRMPLHVSCCFAILGHVAYALAFRTNFLYLILIGRCLLGVAFSMFMYGKRYCTDPRIVGIRRRTTLASWMVISQGMGMSLGPFLGGVMYDIGFSNSIFNGYTSPGWIMAGILAGFWVLVAKYFEDIPQPPTILELQSASDPNAPITSLEVKGGDKEASPDYPSASATRPASPVDESFRAQLSLITLSQWGVIACMCWFSMLCFFILGSWEANLPVFGAADENLRWSPFAAGNFIALGGITAARRTQDRKILAFGTILGLSGLIIFFFILRTGKVNYGSLFTCWWSVALGFNLATTVTLSLLSKQLPPEWNGCTSMAIQYSNYTGRVTGAIWGGSGVSVGMMNFVGLEIVMVAIGAVFFTTLWRNLKTKTG